jgi:hypothetical protein
MLAGLSRLAPRRVIKLQAALKGVAGFTGSGVVRAETRDDGRRRIDADLSGIAGLKAEVVIGVSPIGALACRDGAVSGRLETARGAPIPDLRAGDKIEIRQNGVAILRGILTIA